MIILGVRNFRVFEILEHLPYIAKAQVFFIMLTITEHESSFAHFNKNVGKLKIFLALKLSDVVFIMLNVKLPG